MTDEQIDLEYAHLQYDKKIRESANKEFEDEEFDQYDKETEEQDSEITDETDYDKYFGSETNTPDSEEEPESVEYRPEEWEDVETDDLDSEDLEDWERD